MHSTKIYDGREKFGINFIKEMRKIEKI